ncbi:ROK family protein [Planotetraspora kaengkrachanensis]|uniref:Sugar kinase n=1 Tax=Planotetraspora kaengkrachanensis TaxID=575193 RepID=A0A8J3M923_9ACTN|nr:ROK family protein [Planotetraspora kaengkrachanensis]GIG80295.1 sugar kinase [Planotetraspora kaengkrachanensis]
MADLVLAVDIGGTKFAAGLVGPDGALISSERVATPPGGDAETLWDALVDLLDGVGSPEDVAGVGIGSGGPMAWPSGEVSPLNMPGWRGFPLRERLAGRFPGVPVRIHNDAVCVAIAEHWQGAGRGSDNMLGMVVSTGVGGGLILGGRLIDGGTGNAGHIGHVVVDPDGPPCRCGGRGCLEAVARGPGLVEWALARGWTPGSSPQSEGLYEEAAVANGRRLALDAAAGDPVASAAMVRAGRAVGIAIASATHLCDLDVVTIGGGLSQAGPLLFDPLEQALREHVRLEFSSRVRVVPATLGQDAGLIGAAGLILAADRYWAPR